MIVDCHTHVWDSPEQLGRAAGLWDVANRQRDGDRPIRAGFSDHLAASGPVDKSFVLAFKSRHLQADISNEYVAGYVRKGGDRLVGFACVDPSSPGAIGELRRAVQELGMKGLVVSPAAQDFHPASTAAMRLYAEAVRLGLPVIFHQAVTVGKLEYARPYLLDEVARELPKLRFVISHLGYPWIEETIVLLSKHPQIHAEISGLLHHPWMAYNALLSAYQAGTMDSLLFGSNFPVSSPAACIETLYSINQFCHGTNLPSIPREQLRQIVERNALEVLGIESRPAVSIREPDTTVIRVED